MAIGKGAIVGIVAVAIIIVGAAYSLSGKQSTTNGTTTVTSTQIKSCATNSHYNFTCSNATVRSGAFTAAISQNTGTAWSTANVFIAGSDSPPSNLSARCIETIPGGLAPGQTVEVSLNSYYNITPPSRNYSSSYYGPNACTGIPASSTWILEPIGEATLYAEYTIPGSNTEQTVAIGYLNIVANPASCPPGETC